jgi:hypothetical protein
MKFFDIEIPLDGLAITLATFLLSPDDLRLRNTIIIAAIHGTLHPYEVSMHMEEESAHNMSVVTGNPIFNKNNSLAHFNDRRFSIAPDTFNQDLAFFKHRVRLIR